MEEDIFYCEICEFQIDGDSDYCPNCGAIFVEVECINHSDRTADGVCVICGEPYCDECLGRVEEKMLCVQHSNYEIYQTMARIFGTSIETDARLAESALLEEGYHPFLYNRKVSPISMGDAGYTLFRSSGDFDGHIINEIKLMVPLNEVLECEEILREMELLDSNEPETEK